MASGIDRRFCMSPHLVQSATNKVDGQIASSHTAAAIHRFYAIKPGAILTRNYQDNLPFYRDVFLLRGRVLALLCSGSSPHTTPPDGADLALYEVTH